MFVVDTVKAVLSPLGAYVILDTPEVALFTKSNDKDIYDSFSVLLPHILWIQHTNFTS